MDNKIIEYAKTWIDENKAHPFFLVISFKAVHRQGAACPPLAATKDVNRVVDIDIEEPRTWEPETWPSDEPGYLSCIRAHGRGNAGREEDLVYLKRWLTGAASTTLTADDGIGEILQFLDEGNLADNTMVIVTADNGHMLGEHGVEVKRIAFQDSIRIPLIIRYPPWYEPGSRDGSHIALNIDIASTVMDAAGLNDLEGASGKSLRYPSRTKFYYQYFCESAQAYIRCIPSLEAILDLDPNGPYKLIHHIGCGGCPQLCTSSPDQLFDLGEDPEEVVNLWEDPGYSRIRVDLESELSRCHNLEGS